MGGYRIGQFMPSFSHAKLKTDSGVADTVPACCCSRWLAGFSEPVIVGAVVVECVF